MTYAIDFGTSNTVIARWNLVTQQAETVALPNASVQLGQNPPLIPSLLYVEDARQGRVIVGQPVRDRALDCAADPRFFRNFKLGIGTTVKGFLPELDGCSTSFEQVGTWFLTQLINQLKTTDPELAQSLVFTVPIGSFEAYRLWLTQVCQALDIDQVSLLDEPTAAALGYGLTDRQTLLVIDFGGGTLDLSLVQLDLNATRNAAPSRFRLNWRRPAATPSATPPKIARVLAKVGQNLGGANLDHWLVDHFSQTQGLAATPLTLRLAERLKIQLSQQLQAEEVYFNDETLESYELALDRRQFEQILTNNRLFERLDEVMLQVLQQARRQGLVAADIDAVLLVGGTAQIPAIQTWVQRYFSASKIRYDRPFEAIAQGALQISQGVQLNDFLYHGYGIRYWDQRQKCHNWHPLIPAGQPYPMTAPIELILGASVASQPSIELIIGELGAETEQTEVYFAGDRLITRPLDRDLSQVQPLNDRDGARNIAQLDPPGVVGSDRIKLKFRVDEQRFLRLTVEDLLTANTLIENQIVVQLS